MNTDKNIKPGGLKSVLICAHLWQRNKLTTDE